MPGWAKRIGVSSLGVRVQLMRSVNGSAAAGAAPPRNSVSSTPTTHAQIFTRTPCSPRATKEDIEAPVARFNNAAPASRKRETSKAKRAALLRDPSLANGRGGSGHAHPTARFLLPVALDA